MRTITTALLATAATLALGMPASAQAATPSTTGQAPPTYGACVKQGWVYPPTGQYGSEFGYGPYNFHQRTGRDTGGSRSTQRSGGASHFDSGLGCWQR